MVMGKIFHPFIAKIDFNFWYLIICFQVSRWKGTNAFSLLIQDLISVYLCMLYQPFDGIYTWKNCDIVETLWLYNFLKFWTTSISSSSHSFGSSISSNIFPSLINNNSSLMCVHHVFRYDGKYMNTLVALSFWRY